MKTISFDDTRWPLVVIRYSDHVDEAEFDELLALLDRNIERTMKSQRKTVVIYDSSSGYQASPRVRKKQAEWMQRTAAPTRLNCVGIGFVMTSALVRGVLTAILWLSDLPAPYTVVGTMEEAEAWCTRQLAAHGQGIPPRAQSGVQVG